MNQCVGIGGWLSGSNERNNKNVCTDRPYDSGTATDEEHKKYNIAKFRENRDIEKLLIKQIQIKMKWKIKSWKQTMIRIAEVKEFKKINTRNSGITT